MTLPPYLDLLRRHAAFLIAATIAVSLAAGVSSGLRSNKYVAGTRIYVVPANPSLSPNPDQVSAQDPSRFVQAQIDLLQSEPVAQQAASYLKGLSPRKIQRDISVSTASTSNDLEIVASDRSPTQAPAIADAVVKAYIEIRKQAAVSALRQAANNLNDQLSALQANIVDLDNKIAALPQSGASSGGQAMALQSARDAATTEYKTIYDRQQQLIADISLQQDGAQIISPAKTPTRPASPRPLRDAAAGAFFGLFASAGLVFLREQLYDRFRSPAEVEQVLGLNILAQLPYDDGSSRAPDELATLARPASPLSEAVRSLRTSVQYTAGDRPIKTVVITSAAVGEGKSVVSANLAAVCAQAGIRTVLVSADLRRPSLSRFFGVPAEAPGLSDLVAGPNGFAGRTASTARDLSRDAVLGRLNGDRSSVLAAPIPNLAFLPSGPVPPNPAELLGSKRMKQVLAELTSEAELIIIDTPPVLAITDAAVLGAQVDAVVLIVVMNETRQRAARTCKAVLGATNAHILGVVINKAPKSLVPYYYDNNYYKDDDEADGDGRRRPYRHRDRAR